MSQSQEAASRMRMFISTRWISRTVPVLALGVFGALFVRHIAQIDGAAIWGAFASLQWWQWGAALVFTALSFRAIGIYDVLVHRILHTRQHPSLARSAGIKAIAISQTLGFGTITSALVRWRCLPDLTASAIAQLSAAVSLSFLAALAVVAALIVPFSGLLPHSGGLVLSGLVALLGLMALARLSFRLGWIPTPVRTKTLFSLLLATFVDTGFAAAALWVLWPEPISFQLLFAAYLVALGAGLLSNAPGGVGAFDLSLLALLPVTDSASTMAALLAFRALYYALPAAIALFCLIRPTPSVPSRPLTHPEATLARQSAHVFPHKKAPLLTLSCWGNGVVLGDLPNGMSISDLRSSGAPRALYKCSAQQATRARKSGWVAIRCAEDALITLATWSTQGAKKRQLRRALNGFKNSGLHIFEVRNTASLTRIAKKWAKASGGERGHSMGRFCPDYLSHQRVFAAYAGKTPVAFVSFHTGPIWTLDLMRHAAFPSGAPLPNGTMHALVYQGILAAKQCGATQLSLASVPSLSNALPGARRTIDAAAGLRRFKQAFDPSWHARYLCARTTSDLILTVATLANAIHNPPPLPYPKSIQRHDENYSIAKKPASCEARATPLGARHNVQYSTERPV
ncbi:phosphatidylglycerol lysyltransferase domain-containing protein [Octadecabacter ascidiaceicola]|nr:phosphatidylglycerol lysyltransferase domain-containing protein [Octadecabacter ascidiaceicola]